MVHVLGRVAQRFAKCAFTMVLLAIASHPAGSIAYAGQEFSTGAGPHAVVTPAHSGDGRSGAACATIVPTTATASTHRNVEANDIIRLRDFGKMDASEADAGGFAVSPDGRYLAIQVRQADPISNSYCQALLVYDLRDVRVPPRVADIGGEYVRRTITLYGLEGFPTGTPEPLTPKWSGDGKWLAFLKREDGITRLFITKPSEKRSKAVSDKRADVIDFDWSNGASQLRFRQNANLANMIDRLKAEGQNGFEFDGRFWSLAELVPYPRQTPPDTEQFVTIGDSDATGRSIFLYPGRVTGENGGAQVPAELTAAISDDGRPAAKTGDRIKVCRFQECAHIAAAWKVPATDEIVFMRREGFAAAQTGIYRWAIRENKLTSILTTDDAIRGVAIR